MSSPQPMNGESPTEAMTRLGIKQVLFSWTDLFGKMRSKMVPASAAESVAKAGAGFAGFAAHLDLQPSDGDVLAYPDWKTLVVLPWKRTVAWVACDTHIDHKVSMQCPRTALRLAIDRLASTHKLLFKTGVELEFHLLTQGAHELADKLDTYSKPCYGVEPLMRQHELIATTLEYMEELGWKPYQADHEDSNGQFEINWEYDDALVTADRCAFFKWMVRELAAKQGMVATFMPKPFMQLTGNSAHVHISLHSLDGANVFKGDGHLGLSPLALSFCGGLMEHARGMAALTNPTVNSYKRINAAPTLSGTTWSPSSVSWTGNNRTHMIRVPDAPRLECRLPDGSSNPYLMPLAVLSAGILGVENHSDPGPPEMVNMYQDMAARKARATLPLNLLDALRALKEDTCLSERIGTELCEAYGNLKMSQWNDYSRTMSAWEIENTLDA